MRKRLGILLHAHAEELERLTQLRLFRQERLDLPRHRVGTGHFLRGFLRHSASPCIGSLPHVLSRKDAGLLRRFDHPWAAARNDTIAASAAPPLGVDPPRPGAGAGWRHLAPAHRLYYPSARLKVNSGVVRARGMASFRGLSATWHAGWSLGQRAGGAMPDDSQLTEGYLPPPGSSTRGLRGKEAPALCAAPRRNRDGHTVRLRTTHAGAV